MKKSKKWFAVVVAGALMASVLACCSVDEKTSESGTAEKQGNKSKRYILYAEKDRTSGADR